MVESKGIISKYSLLSSIRGIGKDELYDYSLTYLEKHVYISSKNLTGAYLYDYYSLTHTSMDYHKIRSSLSHRFGQILSRLVKEKRISGYSPKVYKRVDIVQSLSTDINTRSDIKNNVSHLIYYQGRFANPKLYDI